MSIYENRKVRESIWRILGPCLFLIIVQGAEFALRRKGLELRTAVQIGKGICVWTAAPLLIVSGFYRLFSGQDSVRICRILSAVLIVLILGISYARMGIYLYAGECMREEETEDGFLICTDYSGSSRAVYEPVRGGFRRPFEGWEEDVLLEKLKERYGSGTELVRELEDGLYLCTAESSRTGVQPFYFQVKNDYPITGNFKYQLLKSDALVFWKTRGRLASLFAYTEEEHFLELTEEAGGIPHAGDERWLNVLCVSEKDASACAADLADWYFYVREDERYFLPEDSEQPDTMLKEIRIDGKEPFFLSLNSVFQWMEDDSWPNLKARLEKELEIRYELLAGQRTPAEEEESGSISKEAWAEAFLERYDGESSEKECAVGDGTVRYRMVCVDAALGSRAYALLKSTDGGASWQVWEMDPFDGQWGMGIDFTFLTEEFGFASLMHNGGDEADLYVTEDGGRSYHPSVFQGVSATLEDGYYYQPYDYPQMPYEEEGRLYVLCGQGADGDYAGGDAAGMALFESTDRGYTFLYQGIRKAGE